MRDTQVWVTAEWVRYLDPDTNRLRLVEYREFVADAVRTIFSEIDDLRTRWRKRTTRDEIVEALAAKGIDLDELGERTGLIEADPLDVLVHIAWNQPLATRTDRVGGSGRRTPTSSTGTSPRHAGAGGAARQVRRVRRQPA